MAQGGNERSTGTGSRFAGYQIYDRHYEKVGKVDDLFVDENDRPEYIGVKMGFLGTSSSLIPMEITRVNDERRLVEVNSEIAVIKESPTFDGDEEITPEFEGRVYAHFGLTREGPSEGRGGYGAYYGEDYRAGERSGVDTEYGERAEFYDPPVDREGSAPGGASASRGDTAGERESGGFRGRDEEEYSSRSIGEERGYADEGRREDRSAAYRDTRIEREEERAGGSDLVGEERRERHREDFGEVDPGVATGSRESGEIRRQRDEAYPPAGGEEKGYAGDERGIRGREERGEVGPGMKMGDTETGEFSGHGREAEGVRQPGSDLEDRDELRVQRSEEELRVGTHEREAGAVNVRKRVRVDREQLRVPKRREEVTVERVPARGVAAAGEIGDEEIRVPVVEEEIVVEKRPVVKEELRIRKDVVEEEEVVEADLRKEEVDVIDETTRRGDAGGSTERSER